MTQLRQKVSHNVAAKLKDHRLKPGGVQPVGEGLFVVMKLKYHRLKPVVYWLNRIERLRIPLAVP